MFNSIKIRVQNYNHKPSLLGDFLLGICFAWWQNNRIVGFPPRVSMQHGYNGRIQTAGNNA